MNSKAVMAVLLATVLGLTGCTKTIHGGGVVTLFQIALNGEPGQPGPAEIGISFTCNDKSNQISGVLNWVDNTNGVSFTARLPWTDVVDIFGGFGVATCADAAAAADSTGMSVSAALINTQGQPGVAAIVAVGEPGGVSSSECGSSSSVSVQIEGNTYLAVGCLDRGNIVFQ